MVAERSGAHATTSASTREEDPNQKRTGLWQKRGRDRPLYVALSRTSLLAGSCSEQRAGEATSVKDSIRPVDSNGADKVSMLHSVPGVAADGQGSAEDIGGPKLSRREDSNASNESFKSIPTSNGIGGSGESHSGVWSDGGDQHGPLRTTAASCDVDDGSSFHLQADLSTNGGLNQHGVGVGHVRRDSDGFSQSLSVTSFSSSSGSADRSSHSSGSSGGAFLSSSFSGLGRRLGLWKQRNTDGIPAGADSAVVALEEYCTWPRDGAGEQSNRPVFGQARTRHEGAIWVIRASHEANLVATGGQCGNICVWHMAVDLAEPDVSGRGVGGPPVAPVTMFRGHTGAILDLAWSSELLLASASLDFSVRVWHTSSATALRTLMHSEIVTSVMFHPVSQHLVFSGCLDGQVRLFDLHPDSASTSKGLLVSAVNTQGIITALTISADGKTLVAGLYEGKCLFFDVSTQMRKIQDMAGRSILSIKSARGKNAKGHKITGLQYSGNTFYCRLSKKRDFEARLLVSTTDSRIRLYRVADMSLLCKYKGHSASIRSQIKARMAPDLMTLAAPSEDGIVYVWTRVPQAQGIFGHRNRFRHSSPLSFDVQRSRGKDAFPSAVEFLPQAGAGALSDDGMFQTVYRLLVIGLSNGELLLLRASELRRVNAKATPDRLVPAQSEAR